MNRIILTNEEIKIINSIEFINKSSSSKEYICKNLEIMRIIENEIEDIYNDSINLIYESLHLSKDPYSIYSKTPKKLLTNAATAATAKYLENKGIYIEVNASKQDMFKVYKMVYFKLLRNYLQNGSLIKNILETET